MKIVRDILARNELEEADGRPLHTYNVTDEEFQKLQSLLTLRIDMGQVLKSTAAGFVIYASEFIRRTFSGGSISWTPLFNSIGIRTEDFEQTFARKLTDEGLHSWQRPLRVSEGGIHQYLYTLMAEGGLPDALMADPGHYQHMVLQLVQQVEAEGMLASRSAPAIAARHLGAFPQAFQNEDTKRLLADLAMALVEIRGWLPEDISDVTLLPWLDEHHPNWMQKLPLRLSSLAIESLVRPVLRAERGKTKAEQALVQRLLRRAESGSGWVGIAKVSDESFLPYSFLPHVSRDLRLRILLDGGGSFLAIPEKQGWRLSRQGGRGDVVLAADPSQAIIASAYVDGVGQGDVTLDPGLPAPDDSASLWRASRLGENVPTELIPISGRGTTKAQSVWILHAGDNIPHAESGVVVGDAEIAPGGVIQSASGKGAVNLGAQVFRIATGQDAEAEHISMIAIGETLSRWTVSTGQAFLGHPIVMGAEGNVPMRDLGNSLYRIPVSHRLGAEIFEWREDGVVLGRIRAIIFPAQLNIRMRETGPGTLQVSVSGVPQSWHVALRAGNISDEQAVSQAGEADLSISVSEADVGLVQLRFSEPESGKSIEVSAPWPSERAEIVMPSGNRLVKDQDVSVHNLDGWRAIFPMRGGTIRLRMGDSGSAVSFAASDSTRLNIHADMARQLLSLAGPDAQINMRAVLNTETARLKLRSYDWASEVVGPFLHLGHGVCSLHAVNLENPGKVAHLDAVSRVDLAGWLGEEDGLWFIQGKSDQRGVMRPSVWAPRPRPFSKREDRIGAYEMAWQRALSDPDDPMWEDFWTLVSNVRLGGDASSLDQVTALGDCPEAAVALLFRKPKREIAEVLDLEAEAPFWWPAIPMKAWTTGIQHAKQYFSFIMREHKAFSESQIKELIGQTISRQAGQILLLRPELKAHIGVALAEVGMLPIAFNEVDEPIPLAVPNPVKKLEAAAQEAARRFDTLPFGTSSIRAGHSVIAAQLSEQVRPLLDAPVKVAETVCGLEPKPSLNEFLQLFALRAADPVWFDEALPAAIVMTRETQS
jgi:hypothetical protein